MSKRNYSKSTKSDYQVRLEQAIVFDNVARTEKQENKKAKAPAKARKSRLSAISRLCKEADAKQANIDLNLRRGLIEHPLFKNVFQAAWNTMAREQAEQARREQAKQDYRAHQKHMAMIRNFCAY